MASGRTRWPFEAAAPDGGQRMIWLPRPLVRLAFELLYGPLAPCYDWVSRTFFLGQWAHWQQAALAFVEGRVLEIGSGTGALQLVAVEQGRDWVAVERSAQMIRQARRRFRRAGVAAGLVRGEAAALPIQTARVDGVVSTFPTEYIFAEAVHQEIARVLRPGGVAVVVLAGALRPTGPLGAVLDQLHHLVVGDAPALEGFPRSTGLTWTARWIPSPQGKALVLIGKRMP
ncbi:MAG: methyltransferase domain-containing protein [Dehalococcoidia bacterium]|nr:methyltransferase domain-containing protein [Dehalococcoidia bacterium]